MAAHVEKCRASIEKFLVKYPAVDELVGKASNATKVCEIHQLYLDQHEVFNDKLQES